MAKRITVVVSQGQSAHPMKRKLEEELVAGLMFVDDVDVTVIAHLYDLTPDGTGMLCLEGIPGDMIVLSWLYPRAAFWTLDRNGIRGNFGTSLLAVDEGSDDEGSDGGGEARDRPDQADDKVRVTDDRPLPGRTIYCVDLRACDSAEPFVEEVQRIAKEAATETVELIGWIKGEPKPSQLERYLDPTPENGTANRSGNGHVGDGMIGIPLAETGLADTHIVNDRASHSSGQERSSEASGSAADVAQTVGGPIKVQEKTARRWYPIIDFSRCTNCMECIDFCLFGVYGVDTAETILVEQPDNCRKGCPACSRVCPENAIIFPQHKTPTIAGSPEIAGSLKIDLSQLFGAPSAVELATAERDEQLIVAGREAVGTNVGIPKRHPVPSQEPKDDLDDLIDAVDELDF